MQTNSSSDSNKKTHRELSRPVRVRYAPSPTGFQHVGGARTALYNYLFAKKMKGDFIIRIEDTDVARSTEESMRMVLQDLSWMGLVWVEGPKPHTLEEIGNFGPYRQSQRLGLYAEVAQDLIRRGHAFYCFLTDEELEERKKALIAQGKPPQVHSPYRDLPLDEAKVRIEKGEKAVVRFRVPDQKTEYILNDLIRGEVRFPSDMVGDFVLLRSDGMPVYNFCCVVDDAKMEISHVLRAEEHLSNTVRQMMIYEAMSWEPPQFGHLSIILGQDRQKLSKRHGATSVNEYKENGFLPEALCNFIALLGWSSPQGQELLSIEEMIEQFSVDRLHAASAVFDEAKLRWVNASHLRQLPHMELFSRIKPFIACEGIILPSDEAWIDRAMALFKTSMETLKDAVELLRPLSEVGFVVEDEGVVVLKWPSTKKVLEVWMDEVSQRSHEFLSLEDFQAIENAIKEKAGVKGKELFQPLRVAIIGKPQGAELKNLIPLLSRNILLSRARSCLTKLQVVS